MEVGTRYQFANQVGYIEAHSASYCQQASGIDRRLRQPVQNWLINLRKSHILIIYNAQLVEQRGPSVAFRAGVATTTGLLLMSFIKNILPVFSLAQYLWCEMNMFWTLEHHTARAMDPEYTGRL